MKWIHSCIALSIAAVLCGCILIPRDSYIVHYYIKGQCSREDIAQDANVLARALGFDQNLAMNDDRVLVIKLIPPSADSEAGKLYVVCGWTDYDSPGISLIKSGVNPSEASNKVRSEIESFLNRKYRGRWTSEIKHDTGFK